MKLNKRIIIFVAFPLLLLNFLNDYIRLESIKPKPFSSVLKSGKSIANLHNDTLIITVLSSHMFDNLVLRRKALHLNKQKYVEDKSIIICLDRRCILYCNKHTMPNCFFTDKYALKQQSRMFTKDYIRINYEKFQILDSFLAITKNALLIDSDVLLFRDPWPYILSTGYSVQWQSEQYTAGQCHVEPNGGLLFVNQDARKFFAYFNRNKDVILNAKQMSQTDQAFILPSVLESKVNGCALNSEIFVGNCQFIRDKRADSNKMISFHGTCASHRQKHKILNNFISSFAIYKNDNISV